MLKYSPIDLLFYLANEVLRTNWGSGQESKDNSDGVKLGGVKSAGVKLRGTKSGGAESVVAVKPCVGEDSGHSTATEFDGFNRTSDLYQAVLAPSAIMTPYNVHGLN